jgi:hypothetical protein
MFIGVEKNKKRDILEIRYDDQTSEEKKLQSRARSDREIVARTRN